MMTYFVLALALLQLPAKPAMEQIPERQSPNSPALRRGERQRHEAGIRQQLAARPKAAQPKRCAKTLWMKPCPVKLVPDVR